MRPKLMVLIPACIALTSCSRGNRQSSAVATQADFRWQSPSATEIFNLRSKCAALARRLLDEQIVIGPALTKSQVSHYNPQTNRCYVDVHVNTADLSRFNDFFSRSLYDGQTSEMLATISNTKGEKAAWIKDAVCGHKCFEAGIEFMESVMADNRKQ